MIDPKRTRIGTWVRHTVKGYAGTFDGTTSMRTLFEKQSDEIGCRVCIQSSSSRQIASPDNLELLTKEPSLEEKHKLNLQRLGLEWKGVRTLQKNIGTAHQRVTHCWSCKHPLDNTVDKECIVCGWILCRCGSCGCGYDL